jgi:hypothetical protein
MRRLLALALAALIATPAAAQISTPPTQVVVQAPLAGSGTCYGGACTVSPAPSVVGTPVNGLDMLGDSITADTGCSILANCYASLLQAEIATNNGAFNNLGRSGSHVADTNNYAFNNLSLPGPSGDPIVTVLEGTNDIGYTGAFYNPIYDGLLAGLSLSTTDEILASASGMTRTGSWSADSSFSAWAGEYSTTNGSTASATVYAPQGVIYVFYRTHRAATGGQFSVSIDSSAATDTISGLSTINAYSNWSGGFNANDAVALARYVVTPGSHTVTMTVTSATGASNYVGLAAFAAPHAPRGRGLTGPKVFAGGVIYQQDDANSSSTATFDGYNRADVALLQADGLDVTFVDVRKYLNSTVDMGDAASAACPVSAQPGLHPDDCGHRHLADAFEDAINPTSSPFGNSVFRTLINVAAQTPASTMDAANGGSADGSAGSPTVFPRGTFCLNVVFYQCPGMTWLNDGYYSTIITTAGTPSRVVFSLGNVAHPTPAQIIAGEFAWFNQDNSFQIGVGSYPISGDASGNLNANGYKAQGTAGVTCSGTPTSSFASRNGIVTHC